MATNERREELNPLLAPHLLKLLKDDQPQVRRAAAHTLHRLPNKEAVPQLIQSLQDPEPRVRQAAALALEHHKDVKAVPGLLELLEDESDQNAKLAVIGALKRLTGKDHKKIEDWLQWGKDQSLTKPASKRNGYRRQLILTFKCSDFATCILYCYPVCFLQSPIDCRFNAGLCVTFARPVFLHSVHIASLRAGRPR